MTRLESVFDGLNGFNYDKGSRERKKNVGKKSSVFVNIVAVIEWPNLTEEKHGIDEDGLDMSPEFQIRSWKRTKPNHDWDPLSNN